MDKAAVNDALNSILMLTKITLIIQGGASGADLLAKEWAVRNKVPVMTVNAEWGRYGLSAGPRRNTKMLIDGMPTFVIALPGGKGTENMKKQARAKNIPVFEYPFINQLSALLN